jgi:hypothetical protein
LCGLPSYLQANSRRVTMSSAKPWSFVSTRFADQYSLYLCFYAIQSEIQRFRITYMAYNWIRRDLDVDNNRYIETEGFWRWWITLRSTGLLDFVHRLGLSSDWGELFLKDATQSVSLSSSPEDAKRSNFRKVEFSCI